MIFRNVVTHGNVGPKIRAPLSQKTVAPFPPYALLALDGFFKLQARVLRIIAVLIMPVAIATVNLTEINRFRI